MPKDVSTPKQTGGGGYTFSDKVSASYLLRMLAGTPPLDADTGQIESVRFEKRVDGWFLDDIVLLLRGLSDRLAAVAISVKSNTQITEDGFPADFTRAVWEQRLHVQTDKFNPSTDYLALASPPLEVDVTSAWGSLLAKAIDADPDAFADRIATAKYDNEIGRKIFASLNCPNDIDSSKTLRDTTNLIKRLRHFQFDFESTPSLDENDCVTRCRDLLRDGGQADATSLWAHLKQLARALATSGGDLTRTQLADRLRSTFSLNEFPDYRPDWRKLSEDFTIRTERVRGKLGGSLELLREDAYSLHQNRPLLGLTGSSGAGKTVLAKKIAIEAAKVGHAIWLDAVELNTRSISEQFSALGIRHSFPELVAQSIGHRGLIVVDGFENLNQTGLANLAVLLRRARVESQSSTWSFLLTCVVDSWESTCRALRREYGSPLSIEAKAVEFSFNAHRSVVLEAFPNMARMLQRPNLASLFGNLKMLDLVLSNANESTISNTWVGESDILDWYWTQHVQTSSDGVARSRLAQKLACAEADQFLTALPISDFSSDECRLATGLKDDHIVWNRDERIGFEHDLLEDWARTRFLVSQQHDIVKVIRDRSINPRWHRAIRLYGLRLLECQPNDSQKWSSLIVALSQEGKPNVEGDLVLEAVAFAANAEQLLQQVWDRLVENEAILLSRLLTRFLHVATLPDPRYVGFQNEVAMSALHRIPYWPLWLPLLRILYAHRAEVIPAATEQITKIADLWLKNSGDKWPLRKEAAQILLDATDYVVAQIQQKNWRVEHDLSADVFSRLLTAAVVFPDAVSELALSLVERRERSLLAEKEDQVEPVEETQADDHDIARLLGLRNPLGDPWPDGPLRRVNHNVHEGFLSSGDPLQILFSVRPDHAKEVLLALLIREPLPTGTDAFHSPIDEFLHVDTERDWTPAMFFQGPFLAILRTNWQRGIETIVSLANFVTERWKDNRNPPPPPVRAIIDGKRIEYFGSDDAYYWYRDSVHSPNVVAPALMALERWLYLCLEQGESIQPAISQILSSSRSTALLGVLVAVGRKQPALFDKELNELVPIWQLQVWEEHYRIQNGESLLGMTMMQWSRWSESIFNMVKEWHLLPHRKTTLGDVLFERFVTKSDFRRLMETIRTEWKQELAACEKSEAAGFLEKIVHRFNERNWKPRLVDNGVALDFVEPEEVTQRLATVREENEQHMAVLTFPLKCRKLIDDRKPLATNELEDFWRQLRKIEEASGQARKQGDAPEHAIVGGIALLMILHEPWLKADPERENWCSEQFVKVLESPPPHPEFHVAESISNYHWNNFAAMLVPSLLAESPSHEGMRSLCAEFVLAFNYSVIQDAMTFAFEHRDKLGDDFIRLQAIVFISSGMRNVHEVAHGGNSCWNCPDVEFDIDTRYDELIDRFIKYETPADLPSLVEIGMEANKTIVEMVRKQREISDRDPITEDVHDAIAKRIGRGRGFEPYHIRAGFSWLANFDVAKDSSERSRWFNTLENLIHGILRPLGGAEEAIFDDKDHSSFVTVPGEWDTWIFELTASVIPRLQENEYGHRLWKPILAFGLDRIHWVESFISAWFIHGLRVADCEANFVREWKEMIAHAWTLDSWRQTEVRHHRSDTDLFSHLMGFGDFGYSYFEDVKYRPFVASMKPEYDKWADEFFPHPKATSAFANFLTFPSSDDHLRDGIRRLAEAAADFQEWHWRDFYYLDHALLKLLEYDWRENSQLISRDAEVRRQFSTILKTMTDRQIPRALELQDKMMRGN